MLPLLIWLIARITVNSHLVAILGAAAVISITEARQIQSKFLFSLSVIFLLGMVMAVVWNWTDLYLMPLLSASLVNQSTLFLQGLVEGAASIALILIYYRQLKHMGLKITYTWYSSTTYRHFIRLLIFFYLFLTLFLTFGYIVHGHFSGSKYDRQLVSQVSAGLALVMSFLPAAWPYLMRQQKKSGKRRSSRRRRHSSASPAD